MKNNRKVMKGTLYWITGLSGAGKTTIGTALYEEIKKDHDNAVLLDGDILRNMLCGESGYSDLERRKRADVYAHFCKMLTDQGIIVICCSIAMYDDVREWNRNNNKAYVEVFLDVPKEVLIRRDQKGMYSKFLEGKVKDVAGMDIEVEYPKNPQIIIQNDGRYSVKECVDIILNYEVVLLEDYKRDTNYWNLYYSKNKEAELPSNFAKNILNELKEGSSLIDLGCGNGRDSLLFATKNIKVTAIDAADEIIDYLNSIYFDNKNLKFVCDDFVTTHEFFRKQYEYCYSRFSLHAINDIQERILVKNVYFSLLQGGKFFIEARSINDDLYGKGKQIGENEFIHNGHYRRFIALEELKEHLITVGFKINYVEESRKFAIYNGETPSIIRIIAQK